MTSFDCQYLSNFSPILKLTHQGGGSRLFDWHSAGEARYLRHSPRHGCACIGAAEILTG
jgi:hypothetical protein